MNETLTEAGHPITYDQNKTFPCVGSSYPTTVDRRNKAWYSTGLFTSRYKYSAPEPSMHEIPPTALTGSPFCIFLPRSLIRGTSATRVPVTVSTNSLYRSIGRFQPPVINGQWALFNATAVAPSFKKRIHDPNVSVVAPVTPRTWLRGYLRTFQRTRRIILSRYVRARSRLNVVVRIRVGRLLRHLRWL